MGYIKKIIKWLKPKSPCCKKVMTSVFDMQRKLDISEDFFFIFDSDDTILSTRRSFVARFEELGGNQFVAYDWVDAQIRIREKLA